MSKHIIGTVAIQDAIPKVYWTAKELAVKFNISVGMVYFWGGEARKKMKIEKHYPGRFSKKEVGKIG